MEFKLRYKHIELYRVSSTYFYQWRAVPLLMPPIVLYWLKTSEMDVGGMVAEAKLCVVHFSSGDSGSRSPLLM